MRKESTIDARSFVFKYQLTIFSLYWAQIRREQKREKINLFYFVSTARVMKLYVFEC